MTYRFYKEDERWYIDLPNWPGYKEELEMVMGADDMLEILAAGQNEITLEVSTTELVDSKVIMIFAFEEAEGAWYHIEGQDAKAWLCSVTRFVFDCFPDKIYIK